MKLHTYSPPTVQSGTFANKTASREAKYLSSFSANLIKDVKMPYYTPNITTFCGKDVQDYSEQDYQNALKYAKSKNGGSTQSTFDLDKLNGIQKGINIFKGLSMQEIVFALSNTTFALNRGCSNHCAHCSVEALPKDKRSGNLHRMSGEDFMSLNEGIRELDKRIYGACGMNLICGNKGAGSKEVISPFYDSDCIELEIFDKQGREYDFRHIADELSKTFGENRVLFDTAGWNPKSKNLQERAEKISEYFSSKENLEKISGFNVSINPFHPLIMKSTEFKNEGDCEKALKFRTLYADRMANALFTFTPILKTALENGTVLEELGLTISKFGLIIRAFPDHYNNPKCPDELKQSYFKEVYEDILKTLQAKYEKDLSGEKKYIKSAAELKQCIEHLRSERIVTYMILSGRAQSFSSESKESPDKTPEVPILNKANGKILDTNGKIFYSHDCKFYPTEVQLNFENKGKPTRHFNNFCNDAVITKDAVNKSVNDSKLVRKS